MDQKLLILCKFHTQIFMASLQVDVNVLLQGKWTKKTDFNLTLDKTANHLKDLCCKIFMLHKLI